MKQFIISISLACMGLGLWAQQSVLSFPEVIYPDGEGENSRFVIVGLEHVPENKLTIFSRWGMEVYSASPYKNDWDGSTVPVQGKGKDKRKLVVPEPLPAGTYFYLFETAQADPGVFKGNLTIVR